MASANSNTVGTLLTPAVEKGDFLPSKRSVLVATKIKTAFVPLQVKCQKEHKSLTTKSFAVSRRDMMQCLTAEVLGLALLPKPTMARVSRLEVRKKIMEKLEELREKAGLSKPKTENEMKSPTKPSSKDKKSPTLPLPPPESAVQTLGEATLSNIPPSNNAL